MSNYLSLEDILFLHFKVVEDYGGLHGIRDESRLTSVVEAPKQHVFGQEQYPDVCEKAAIYARNIIADYPFLDGNKRTGITCAAIFLARNKTRLTATPKELEDFAVAIATESFDVPTIAKWFKNHSS